MLDSYKEDHSGWVEIVFVTTMLVVVTLATWSVAGVAGGFGIVFVVIVAFVFATSAWETTWQRWLMPQRITYDDREALLRVTRNGRTRVLQLTSKAIIRRRLAATYTSDTVARSNLYETTVEIAGTPHVVYRGGDENESLAFEARLRGWRDTLFEAENPLPHVSGEVGSVSDGGENKEMDSM